MIKYLFSELSLRVPALLARVVYLKLQTSESNYTARGGIYIYLQTATDEMSKNESRKTDNQYLLLETQK